MWFSLPRSRFVINGLRSILTFNLFCLPIVVAGFCAASYFVWGQLWVNAEQESLDKGRVMLETARAVSTYTESQIARLLNDEQARMEKGAESVHQILDVHLPEAMQKAIEQLRTAREQQALEGARQQIVERVRQEQHELPKRQFFKPTIPFYATTEVFNYLRVQFPDYGYKEAALNPTNPRDRTSDREREIVDMFRNNPSKKEFVDRRDTPVGPMLYISTPIRVDDNSCLDCHGAADKAPPEILHLYGGGNGFGWSLNEVVGAQIMSIPAQVAQNRAVAAQRTIMFWLAGVFAVVWALINIVVFIILHKPNEFATAAARMASSAR
jgi:hypothetical protein